VQSLRLLPGKPADVHLICLNADGISLLDDPPSFAKLSTEAEWHEI
jgi:hypothetical protein